MCCGCFLLCCTPRAAQTIRKNAECHEKDAFTIKTRCHKNSKKMKKQCSEKEVEGGAKWCQGLGPLSQKHLHFSNPPGLCNPFSNPPVKKYLLWLIWITPLPYLHLRPALPKTWHHS
jgi:hypothetical protein